MPARAPSLLVTAESPLCVGLRVRRWRSRSAGQMRPHIPRRRRGLHRTTGATLSYSVVGALCPRRCPLSYLGSPTGPFLGRGCVVRSFFGTTARSARLAPTDRLRLIAYTVRPAVRGCSRRGTSPSQLCVMPLAPVPLSIRRRDSSTALARLFAEGNSLRLGERGSALSGPQHPLLLRGDFDAATFASCYGPSARSPPWWVPPSRAAEALSSELSPERSPYPGVRFPTRVNGQFRAAGLSPAGA